MINNKRIIIVGAGGSGKDYLKQKFIDIPKDIRKSRLLNRNDADSVDRRLQTDSEDFNDFKDYDIRITNCDF